MTPVSALAAAAMSGSMAGAGANLFLATNLHVAAAPRVIA
jgi:hypothetical protein